MESKHIVPEYIKNELVFCISFFYILILCQCKNPARKQSDAAETRSELTTVKAPLPTAKIQDSITININQGMQVISWASINTDFISNCLNPFLASKRIKSDCTDCDQIMFSFSFAVDGKGKIQTILKEGENVSCIRMSETDKKKLEKEILIYMKKMVLPAPFYKTIYKSSLGFIRKC